MRYLLPALILMLLPAGAQAMTANLVRGTDGIVYFNRPGADFAAHDSELKNCIETWPAGVVFGRPTSIVGSGVLDQAIGSAVTGMMINGWERARRTVNIEHCMVSRGWRLVRLPEPEGKRLAALDKAELRTALAPMIGASEPPGEIVRIWRNEAAWIENLANKDPQGSRQTLLSAKAMDPEAPDPAQKVEITPGAWNHPAEPLPALKPEQLASVRAHSALVLVKVAGPLRFRGYGVAFRKAKEGAAHDDFEIFAATLIKAPKVDGRYELIAAYAVPPGRWTLVGMGMTQFCLGAPSFEAQAGDVVFLGSFDFGRERLEPDMTMTAAENYLQAFPDLSARLRPAAWRNGSVTPCGSWYSYAMEFEGYPHLEGYHWGSAAAK